MLTFISYVQGGIGKDGLAFDETYIVTIPPFQWVLVSQTTITYNL